MSSFNFINTPIKGVTIIEPKVFGDDRGYFLETYQKDIFSSAGLDVSIKDSLTSGFWADAPESPA